MNGRGIQPGWCFGSRASRSRCHSVGILDHRCAKLKDSELLVRGAFESLTSSSKFGTNHLPERGSGPDGRFQRTLDPWSSNLENGYGAVCTEVCFFPHVRCILWMGAPDRCGIGRQLGRCGPISHFGARTLTRATN